MSRSPSAQPSSLCNLFQYKKIHRTTPQPSHRCLSRAHRLPAGVSQKRGRSSQTQQTQNILVMPRKPRLDKPGFLHHVMVRGIEKGLIMLDDIDRKDLLTRIGQIAEQTGTWIYAYALMPNHFHLLVRSGELGLSDYMRRLLTGYAVYFNRRHERVGHLFQNRYHSLVCQEDDYFTQLIAYIHLNPYKANMLHSLTSLKEYPWTSHPFLLGCIEHSWMDRDYVLQFFGQDSEEGLQNYLEFLIHEAGIDRSEELRGGGGLRSNGCCDTIHGSGTEEVMGNGDIRILGKGEFVEKILTQCNDTAKNDPDPEDQLKRAVLEIERVCAVHKCSIEQLRSGARTKPLPLVRKHLAEILTGGIGLKLSHTAKLLGVTPQGIVNMLRRK
ncbi:hypothetical protein FGF68_04685 [Prosthecochloris vibrioformis]|uniref:Transposase IS200-like domain-containing protein n=2 Tax=Prosthecochloris vibrioformis TaxID=1098 RepID=A0A5C4S132_PROVB|nr:hypothetical protein FGF68_04685 [Prosthecochloris vibrioformis]